MIDYNDILYFDTETTGIPPKDAKWDLDFESFPRIVQLSWIYKGVEHNHIIKPDNWEIPTEAAMVHGITTEKAQEQGEPLEYVISEFINDCKEAKLICGHNIYFDVSVVKSEYMRRNAYNGVIDEALHKGKRIDTMRPSMRFVGATFSNGRLKLPKLEELYARCFPGERFPAHDAIEDVRAVVRCLPVLVDYGIIKLEVKQYETEQTKIPFEERPKNEPNLNANQKDDKLPINEKKCENTAKQEKITDTVAALMADDLF